MRSVQTVVAYKCSLKYWYSVKKYIMKGFVFIIQINLIMNNTPVCFEDMYHQYYKKIYMYFKKRINSKFDAEDLTNDVFLACYKKLDTYDGTKASMSTWIYVIASNRLKNYYRDSKISISIDDNEHLLMQAHDDLNTAIALDEMKKVINCAFGVLSEKEQKIIIMKYYLELNSEEISRHLSITAVNVRVILMRALKKMNKCIEK